MAVFIYPSTGQRIHAMTHVKHTSLRIKPDIRALADRLCELEHRDLTNMIEIALIEYGRQRGITLYGATEGPSDGNDPAAEPRAHGDIEMLKRCMLALAKKASLRRAGG